MADRESGATVESLQSDGLENDGHNNEQRNAKPAGVSKLLRDPACLQILEEEGLKKWKKRGEKKFMCYVEVLSKQTCELLLLQ